MVRATPDELDRRHAEHFLDVARRLESLLHGPPDEVALAAEECAVVGSQILQAQRHAARLASDPRMAAAIRDFAGLTGLGQHFGAGQWRRWAQDAYSSARVRLDPREVARAAGDLAKAAADAGDRAAVGYFAEAIEGHLAVGGEPADREAAELASMALRAALEAGEKDRLRDWLELAEAHPGLSDHGRCRVAIARAQLLEGEGEPAAAVAEAARAREIAEAHHCLTCRAFVNAVASRIFGRRRDPASAQSTVQASFASFASYAATRRWPGAAEMAYQLLGFVVYPDRFGMSDSPGRPEKIAEFAEHVARARESLHSAPLTQSDHGAAALLAWVHASALRLSGQNDAAEVVYRQVLDEFAADLEPAQRADAFRCLAHCFMLRSRAEAEAGNWPGVDRLHEEAAAWAQASSDPDLRVRVGSEIISRLMDRYRGSGSAELYKTINSELTRLTQLAPDGQLTPDGAALRRRIVGDFRTLLDPQTPPG